MAKVTLTFDLPEERTELFDALNGFRWKFVAMELDEWLRQKIKYEDRNHLQEARDRLHEIKDEEGLSLWD